jgi:hypothetical protein
MGAYADGGESWYTDPRDHVAGRSASTTEALASEGPLPEAPQQ